MIQHTSLNSIQSHIHDMCLLVQKSIQIRTNTLVHKSKYKLDVMCPLQCHSSMPLSVHSDHCHVPDLIPVVYLRMDKSIDQTRNKPEGPYGYLRKLEGSC